MRTTPFLLLGLLILAALAAGCRPDAGSNTLAGGAKIAKYHCPMHPTYVSDRPGECPICHMNLELIDKGGGTADASPSANTVPGRVAIRIDPTRQQHIGLKTVRVEPRDLTSLLHAPGVLRHDETALAQIAPRVGGWVRTLHVNYTGQAVTVGQPLLTVYSPELLVAERDYLLARREADDAGRKTTPDQQEAARRLLEGARQRLKLWEIRDDELQTLEKRGQPSDELLLRAPVSGHVIAKNAFAGRAFMAGETLFEIGQLSRLWVLAAVLEQDLPKIRVGQQARVIFPQLGNRAVATAVTFVSPHVNPQTRRGEVRLEIDNSDHTFLPEMWASVELANDHGRVLAVPASAVIDTGTRTLAFVQRADHYLEPREVEIGARTEEWWEVKSGLEADETVVTRALFLVDSESQLRAAIAAMTHAGEPEH